MTSTPSPDQIVDLAAQRRLRDTNPLCRAAKIQLLGNCEEVAKVP